MTATATDTTTPHAYETKDSGSRVRTASGMQREVKTGQPRFDLLVPLTVPYPEQLLTRTAALVERGARKYESRDWEQASTEAEAEEFRASAFRHFMQWMCGEDDEDHAAAVVFNVLAAETTATVMARRAAETEEAAR
ncbi:MAG: DUF5664 domain-containing protein [Kocuria sp.]|nr:DUF5664 domain-containing protein [Kocuria sp.]